MSPRNEFSYEPPLEAIAKRLMGAKAFEKARQELIDEKKAECAAGKHAWRRVAYDLQGGKWGTERCVRCGAEETWEV